MGQIIDNAIAVRIIYLLVHPFTSWDAFKLGIINKDGKAIAKPKNQKEKDSWTMLHRLVSRIKRIIAIAPGGKSLIANIAASYLLVRESHKIELTDDELIECYIIALQDLTEADIMGITPILEDMAPMANTTMILPVTRDNQPSTLLGPKPKKKKSYKDENLMFRRSSLLDTTKV